MKKFLFQFFLLMGILLLALNLPTQPVGLIYDHSTKDTIFMYSDNWHRCDWPMCPYQGKAIYVSPYNIRSEEGYEANYMDSLHFYHPDWTFYDIFILIAKHREEMQYESI